MLAPGNYVQWKSRIKRYIDTKPNHELIHYCLKNPPYELGWKDKEVPTSEGSLVTITERVNETYKNFLQDIRDQLNAEAEAVQIILTGIDNDIYLIIDACPNACEMRKAIKRLKQGESINVQDLETNLYWEFRKFTSQDGESLELYYSRFVTLVKQSQELKTVSYHKLYYILKQQQHEVNEIRAEKIAHDETSKDKEIDKLMALISLSFKKIYKPTNNNLRTSSNTSRANQDNSPKINRNVGYEDQRISNVAGARENVGSSVKIYKPTNNNLRTSSNTSRANQDNSSRINRSAGYENQRIGNVAEARETVGSSVVQKSGIQCYNCKEFRHVGREYQKPKRAKDAAYHREKMILCKQEEAEVQLNAEQVDWRDDIDDDELEDQELEAHYIAHPDQSKSVHDTYPIEQDTQNVIIDSLDMNYDKEEIDQNDDDIDLAKESNNSLSETNNLLYADYKKSEAELARRNSKEYASQMELECAKVRVIPRHEKTPYHIINDQKPSVKFFYIFGSTCYIVRDGENLDKMKEKGDACIFVGYSTQSRAYRVFNKRTRVIMESIHVNFDELPQMASDQISSDPAPECQTMALNHDSLSLASQHQENVPQAERTVTTSNELNLLFSSMFDELLNGSSKVVSKYSVVSAADAPNQRQQHTTPLNIHTTPAPTCHVQSLAPTDTSSENINQAEPYAENDQVADDEWT
nr:hypothetical protein [Tanacetum cinerariifolium]